MSRTAYIAIVLVVVCHTVQSQTLSSSNAVLMAVNVEPIRGAPAPPEPTIVNGSPAKSGQFPYQAAVYIAGRGFCGGSLISENTVLTAAHCVELASEFVIYLGTIDLRNIESGSLIINTRRYIKHEKYNSRTLNNDIALIGLGQDITLTDTIKPITLASGVLRYTGFSARVSGWGLTRDGGSQPDQLRYADLIVISNARCRRTYGGSVVVPSVVCARKKRRSPCSGDSGGPLVAKGKQIGVVSFAAAVSCQKGYPSGYTRVSSFSKWIASRKAVLNS